MSGAASCTIQYPAPKKAAAKKRESTSKVKNKKKDILVKLVTELKDREGDNLICFGLTKTPETQQMKKNINSMTSSQAIMQQKMQWPYFNVRLMQQCLA